MEREVFVCPFCGAPDREATTSDTPRTTCKYCGAQVTLPRKLLGPTRRCTNHPEFLSVGQCAACGRNFCEQCLLAYSWGFAYALRPVCPSCAEELVKDERTSMKLCSGLFLLLSISVILFAVPSGQWGFLLLLVIFVPIFCMAFYAYIGTSRPPTTETAEEWWSVIPPDLDKET